MVAMACTNDSLVQSPPIQPLTFVSAECMGQADTAIRSLRPSQPEVLHALCKGYPRTLGTMASRTIDAHMIVTHARPGLAQHQLNSTNMSPSAQTTASLSQQRQPIQTDGAHLRAHAWLASHIQGESVQPAVKERANIRFGSLAAGLDNDAAARLLCGDSKWAKTVTGGLEEAGRQCQSVYIGRPVSVSVLVSGTQFWC